MKTLGERIEERLKDLEISQKELAYRCGLKPPSISDWISGKTKSLKGTSLIRAANALAVSPLWLSNGPGNKALTSPSNQIQNNYFQENNTTTELVRIIEHMLSEDKEKLLEHAKFIIYTRQKGFKKQRDSLPNSA